MKVFVTGVGGQLGHDCVNELTSRGHEAVGSDIQGTYSGVADGSAVTVAPYVQLDITDQQAVAETVDRIAPDVIIHCAAWTAVDAAEDAENREKVDKINRLGTQYIAEAAKAVYAKMVYISTDYVFDGQSEWPWEPDDKCYAPLNVYGQSKLDGELAVRSTLEKYFIVRIALVFGLNGKNFIKTMINVGKTHDTVRVVNDQIGTPTYTLDLAILLVDMVETEKYGYYHATNECGYISWYDFCCEFYKQYGLDTTVIPVTTEEYGLSKSLGLDPSMTVTMILAIDMGGFQLAKSVALDVATGNWADIVYGSMMGATIVFSIPVGLAAIQKKDVGAFSKGILYGITAIPVGTFVGGLIMGIPYELCYRRRADVAVTHK